jgi:hypothetical protein
MGQAPAPIGAGVVPPSPSASSTTPKASPAGKPAGGGAPSIDGAGAEVMRAGVAARENTRDADLPDPLLPNESSSSPGSAGAATPGTDDLLSQLAGEEIDRLLAQAEAELPELPQRGWVAEPPLAALPLTTAVAPIAPLPASTAIPAVDPAAPIEQVAPIATAASAELAEIPAEAIPAKSQERDKPVDAPAPTIGSSRRSVSADAVIATATLDASLIDQELSDAAPAVLPAAPAMPAMPPAAPADVQPPSSSTSEGAAPASNAAADLGAAIEVAVEETCPPGRDSLLVTLLELINAPLNAFPNTVRELIGKVAILTLFNAIAVIVYVVLFRHRH